jgi:hypothetical protein
MEVEAMLDYVTKLHMQGGHHPNILASLQDNSGLTQANFDEGKLVDKSPKPVPLSTDGLI